MLTFDKTNRDLMDTRMWRKPLVGIQDRINSLIKGEENIE